MKPRRKHCKREYELNYPAHFDAHSVHPPKRKGDNTASSVYDGPQNYSGALQRSFL